MRSAERLANDLAEVIGEGLSSVILYGSAAREEFHEGSSDVNVLVLVREVDESLLRRCAGIARTWMEAGNPPPLILSDDELRRSLDIFPIEYADIRDSHRVLRGVDPFPDLVIRREHLRLQCERELKIGLIQLRERYLVVADDVAGVSELLRGSISAFLVQVRTILRIEGVGVPADSEAAVRLVAERAGFAPDPFLRVLRGRRDPDRFTLEPGDTLAADYLEAAARLVAYVDGLDTASVPAP